MTFPRWAVAAAVASFVLLTSTAQVSAATVNTTIWLKGARTTADSYFFSAPGLGLKVTGYLFNGTNGVLKENVGITRNRDGLGIQLPGEKRALVDGKKGRELVRFKFDRKIKVRRVIFSYFDSEDDFELIKYKGKTVVRRLEDNLIVQKRTGDGQYNGSRQDIGRSILGKGERLWGRNFGIGSDFRGDQFKIKAISVRYDDETAVSSAREYSSPAPVPLPAAGVLMLAGLGALGFAARRRR